MPTGAITDISIVAAALIAQFAIVVIMFLTSAFVSLASRGQRGFAYIILFLALVTLIPLMFTRGYSSTWGPLLGAGETVGIPRSTSMPIVFLADILAVHALVWLTGGSRESPFQAIYFLLPTLALFLREPLDRVLVYLLFVIGSYTYLTVRSSDNYRVSAAVDGFAYWLNSVSCFSLATYIGYVTRPL